VILFGMAWHVLASALVGGYLRGSIPFGVLVTRFAGVGDVRAIGSGNIGATNVLRTGRKDLALATLIGDAGKAMVAVALFRALFSEDAGAVAGAAAFLGHLFPVWLGFKGGKGVATFLGVFLVMDFPVGLMACATWVIVAAIFRFSSLSALVAVAMTPLYLLLLKKSLAFVVAALFMAVLVYWRHRANIQRLARGEEPRIGSKAKSAAPAAENGTT
jgi:glycerol-3-phosphate acyltransferase PlsY